MEGIIPNSGGDIASRKVQASKLKNEFQGALQQFQASSQVRHKHA